MTMATSSSMPDRQQRLLQLIECPICLSEQQDPRILSCRHIYCYKCLKDYHEKGNHGNDLPCPQCREETTLNQGDVENLPKFFFMNELKEVVMAKDTVREDNPEKNKRLITEDGVNMVKEDIPQKRTRVVCSTEDCGQLGLKYCKQCGFLCQQCYDDHSKARFTKSHEVITVNKAAQRTDATTQPLMSQQPGSAEMAQAYEALGLNQPRPSIPPHIYSESYLSRQHVLANAAKVLSGGGVSSQQLMADSEKRKLIQQQLVLLLHAHKCHGERRVCNLPHCGTTKGVLNHMTTCNAGKSCQVAHCSSSRQIISHWKYCTRNDCSICLPLKHAGDKRNNADAQSSNVTPQTTQMSQQPGSAEMALACEALGLNPVGPPGPKAGLPQSGAQAAALLGLNATGTGPQSLPRTLQAGATVQHSLQHQLSKATDLPAIMKPIVPGANDMVAASNMNKPMKEWHESVPQDLRNILVDKLVQAIMPLPDPTALKNKRMTNLVQYARKVESDMYDTANSREGYYYLLAEEIYKIQNEPEEKRMKRIQVDGGSTASVAPAAGAPAAAAPAAAATCATQRPVAPTSIPVAYNFGDFPLLSPPNQQHQGSTQEPNN